LRVKGVLNVADEEGPVVIHGVQHIFHPPVAPRRWPDGGRTSRLVSVSLDYFSPDSVGKPLFSWR
jgi:G3E family GTPase